MSTPIDTLRQDLRNVAAKGKLDVLAAVAGISTKRLRDIMEGKVAPTLVEMTTINMLKG